ncbi:MAG TPA: lipopolysaccharide assembly protein LapA domain-containing protein [Sphingomonas sp.]|jgi:hypothetical protein|nr:lipopolysaccharide assembly protein LapA domain-containing protein [Sphingomonas sp.]
MQFLKILFWCLLAFVAALFTYGNWTSVPIQLWSGMEALVKLPFLLLIAFLIGFLPTWLYYHAVRWRLRQRLAATERALAEARAVPPPAYVPPAAPVAAPAVPTTPPAPIADPLAEGRLV